MDEARTVLERLERIERLDRQDAPAADLLAELRALVSDAETWLRSESHPRAAADAVDTCRGALDAGRAEEVTLNVR